jgi:hypothetical protein
LLAGIVIAGLAAAWAFGQVLDRHVTMGRDRHEVMRMTQKMKTACVGRFLIDLPEDAQIELARPRIDGFEIAASEESYIDFQDRMAEREAQIKATPDRNGEDKNLELVKDVKTASGLIGKIFVHGRTVSEGTQANGLELEHYRYEGVAVEASVHGKGISIDLAAENYDPEQIQNLPRLVAQLETNPDNQAPTVPAFCIGRAYFRDLLAADQSESIMMVARLPTYPDVEFTLMLAAGTMPDTKGLLERTAESYERLSARDKMRVSTLRSNQRTIGTLAGDEVAERVIEENHSIVYSFWWEVIGTADDVMMPHLSFTMDTGKGAHGPVPSSLSEGAAIELWDKISSSIRIRPAAVLREQAQEITTPIGAFAWAGERCPQSGWWECSDGGNGIGVLGGERQHIRQGERMPQALLLPPKALWQKMRGLQPSFQSKTRTAWRLVDKRLRSRTVPPHPLVKATVISPVANLIPCVIEAAGAAVGSLAATGAPCPASGWWRCEDSNAMDGTRWFARGNLLPPATFVVPPSVFGRSANRTASFERRSAWRLMRLADVPERGYSEEPNKTA